MSYIRLESSEMTVSAKAVSAPLWSNATTTLENFYTSSIQEASNSGDYFLNVFNTDVGVTGSSVQFGLGYANKYGSGSLLYNSSVDGKSPTSVLYGQYRNLVLGDEDSSFTFGDTVSDSFYAIAIDRARLKEKLLPGSLTLVLGNGTDTIHLTDDSLQISTVTYSDSGRVYELISGSLGTISPSSLNSQGHTIGSGSYGKLLPDIGIILLNAKALAASPASGGISYDVDNTSNSTTENLGAFNDILNSGSLFQLNSEETVSSTYFYLRAKNAELNYSTNPSFITGSGELRHPVMINEPQVYITTVGLYNDTNDLLAVSKLSKPLPKDFVSEALLRIKLDF
jgi:hypothetical protein